MYAGEDVKAVIEFTAINHVKDLTPDKDIENECTAEAEDMVSFQSRNNLQLEAHLNSVLVGVLPIPFNAFGPMKCNAIVMVV